MRLREIWEVVFNQKINHSDEIFLKDLQKCHDYALNAEECIQWLKNLADRYDLTVPSPSPSPSI